LVVTVLYVRKHDVHELSEVSLVVNRVSIWVFDQSHHDI